MKPLEPFLHVLMGYLAGLFGLHLILTWREYLQLPPENDRFPAIWTKQSTGFRAIWMYLHEGTDEYWSKSRVMDTLNDSREYVIGYTLATVTHLAVIVWLVVR